MTIKTRSGIFETNSSSSHSITIANSGILSGTLLVDKKGVCRIFPGEFGWGPETYYDAETKASYAFTFAKTCAVANSSRYLAMLSKVVKKHTGARVVKFCKIGDEYWPYGYIDHQSSDVCEDAFLDEITLRRFIFDKHSVLEINNDNG